MSAGVLAAVGCSCRELVFELLITAGSYVLTMHGMFNSQSHPLPRP
jgi:hypothetical protein